MITRAEKIEHIGAIASHLGDEELSILVLTVDRLAKGQHKYGELRLATDRRNFRREALEELVDAVFYLAADLQRGVS